MAYRVGSGETGALGIQYDDRDRDAANVRNQATQINAQQAAEARRLAAAKAAQDSAAAAQMYGVDRQFALGTRGQDISLAQSGTRGEQDAAALNLEGVRQAPGERALAESQRRFDLDRADGQGARDIKNDMLGLQRGYLSRFTGGGSQGGMAAGASMAGGMDPVDQALSDDLSERDMMGMAMAFGGADGISSFMQNRGEEKRYTRDKAEAKEERDRSARTAMAESAIKRGDQSGYKSYADASDGLFTEEQARAGMQPTQSLESALPLFQSMAQDFNKKDTAWFGSDPSEAETNELLQMVETVSQIIMRQSNVPEAQARQMAVAELRKAMSAQDADAESDWGSDGTADLLQRARGGSGQPAGRGILSTINDNTFRY